MECPDIISPYIQIVSRLYYPLNTIKSVIYYINKYNNTGYSSVISISQLLDEISGLPNKREYLDEGLLI